jgi:hypothetical protein
MFKLSTTPSYIYPVVVEIPGGEIFSFNAKFKRLTQTELDAMQQRIQADEITDDDIVDQVLLGWDDQVKDEDDTTPLPFTEENKARVLAIVPTRGTIVRTFFESLAKAKKKP